MRIVSDTQVQELLGNLTPELITSYQNILATALQQYHFDPSLIPERIVINKPSISNATHIFMPSFTSTHTGIKTLGGSVEGFKGAVLILDKDNGVVKGMVNAMSLTGFRTALASSLALRKFFEVEKKNQVMSVYGNGAQAYWHVKVTLSAYPGNFNKVNLIVRSRNEKSLELVKALQSEFPDVEFELIENGPAVDLKSSTVIYGCIPSTTPSIHLDQLATDHQVFISLIGSYKPNMFEVDDAIVLKAKTSGKIMVDSYEHTLAEAGELIKNRIDKRHVIELGELEYIEKEDIVDPKKSNLVLAKIVGLSIMDVAVGGYILEKAKQQNIGIETDF
ncbi:hypothetical protein WICPIJ_009006 [Wickerhamomyces pijperi]|uniref:Ornithine cyclodeaminase n=1 Tax=Wickerhamomyces pijperi TaxID=599730 RepID=A0A9P8PS66_WICPI|nr:hypothetical protein WICPIJ_009006 [Wickerhamomyces pijperi]